MTEKTDAAKKAEAYYDSPEANEFYQTIWGGQDIHVGIYRDDMEPIADASHRTVETMATWLAGIDDTSHILDLGSGYGGSARYLADKFGCHVTCLNVSKTQNEINRKLTANMGLTDRVRVVHGNFEDIPEPSNNFDAIWSQDALLHSGNRRRVLEEVRRVLIKGGQFVFTDPMQSDNCPDGVLQPILKRIHLSTLASFAFYHAELNTLDFNRYATKNMTNQLRMHYYRVGEALKDRYDEALQLSGQTYVDNMLKGLQHWINGADNDYLTWGMMDYRLTT